MKEYRFTLLGILLNKYEGKLRIDTENGTVVGLKNSENHKGYLVVKFWHEKKSRDYRVHELIAYVGGLDLVGNTVNHINGNKKDNRLINLECISALENHRKAKDTNSFLCGSEVRGSKLTEDLVNEIRTIYTGKWGEQTEMAKKYGVDQSTVNKILRQKLWKRSV
jgi:hypothetical protein